MESALAAYKNSLKSFPAELYDSIKYTMELGGKRTRPVMVLAGCDLFKGDIEKALPAAVAVELLHNFTLVHDDIMDNAPLRRNKPTVYQRWNANTAILCGDALMIQAFGEINKSEEKQLPYLLQEFCAAALKVCEGQQLDMQFEQQENVSIADYLKMIELKTAVLLAASLKLGAITAGAPEEDAGHLYQFGRNIGIAFQLHDDILDVFGNPEKFGKQTGGDIISNKKTFLLLKAFEMADEKKKKELLGLLHEKDHREKVAGVKKIYHELDIKSLAEEEKKKFYEKAVLNLNAITAPEDKKSQLLAFADGLIKRES